MMLSARRIYTSCVYFEWVDNFSKWYKSLLYGASQLGYHDANFTASAIILLKNVKGNKKVNTRLMKVTGVDLYPGLLADRIHNVVKRVNLWRKTYIRSKSKKISEVPLRVKPFVGRHFRGGQWKNETIFMMDDFIPRAIFADNIASSHGLAAVVQRTQHIFLRRVNKYHLINADINIYWRLLKVASIFLLRLHVYYSRLCIVNKISWSRTEQAWE